jgi:phosphocarrier protein
VAQREVIVGSRIGLHARPAALFVKAASEQPVKITIRKGDGAAEALEAVAKVVAEDHDDPA